VFRQGSRDIFDERHVTPGSLHDGEEEEHVPDSNTESVDVVTHSSNGSDGVDVDTPRVYKIVGKLIWTDGFRI
jgi:hypothetical protein